ncbi:SurA N-terminal domain-containing protein [Pelagibacteraceae bacterium]|nr:SurA N-terminal domain-containing protein [Pelagibacteraceae bacterium]
MRFFRNSWIGIGLAILFGASLFFFRGQARYSNLFNSDNFVADISGTPISTTKFMRSMDMNINQFSQMIGSKLTGDQVRSFQVHQIALQNLVNSAVFENEFEKINFILDDTTIAKETKRNFPDLYINNKLDDEMLNTFLRRQGLKIEDLVDLIDFETRSIVFDQLFFQKNYPLQLQINFNKYDNQKRDIELLKIPYDEIKLENYSKDQISKENNELLDYFNNNSAAYMTKEERDISYILISKSDYRDNFSPSENSLIEYYNNNKNLFINPEERSFKQFNFKSIEEADNFKIKVSGKTNEEIIKYAEENNIIFNDFKNVDKNKVLEQLANAIFELDKGSMSDVVQTTLAYHIIILDEIFPEKELTFDEVKNEINNTLINFEVDNYFNELKSSLDQQILDGFSITEIADQNNLKLIIKKKIINNTNEDDPTLNNVISFSFTQNKDFVSDLVDIDDDTSFIVNIDGIYPSKIESIDNIFDSVLNDFIFTKKTEQAENIFENNKEIFTNISKFYATNPENLNLSLKTNDELPISFKQKIFETDIDKVAFGSDENAIYFANIKSIKMPEEGENTSNINLIGDLKTAFGSEIIKTKEISFNDELINGLLSQYK